MKYSKGFTLIELIVVMAVFLFVIGAAISIFISIVQNQKRVLSEQELLNQISYVEEYMSKALRMATKDTSGSCLGSDNLGYIYLLTRYDFTSSTFKGIKFLNQSDLDFSGNPTCQEFFLDTDNILKEEKNNDATTVTPLTSANLQLDPTNPIRFSVNGSNGSTFTSPSCMSTSQCGASENDSVQPKITILLNVKISGDSQNPERTIQTTVSQRNLNAK
ncbi:MAG: type II secretion system protein [Candidatus Staskawiczbacteria bacterium]|jgi:prepilin-type N-terminal cleavage/methylation domain-containing protein